MPNEINITGWDFSPLTSSGRMTETPLPWDYAKIIKRNFEEVISMLDMGTGGGEFLKTLTPLPPNTIATEGYGPNVTIAEKNLQPLGVKVIGNYKDDALPFEDDYFDLIINRHEYYDANEVYRILKPGGKFLTQQVKGNCDETFTDLFGVSGSNEYADWNLTSAINGLQEAGFSIIQKSEAEGFTIFKDTEAVISYLKVINWLIPDFSRVKYCAELENIENVLQREGYFKSTLDRLFIAAEKKNPKNSK